LVALSCTADPGVGAEPQLLSLALVPPAVSLAPEAMQQYALSATWSDAGNRSPGVEYDVTGGTISGGGLYTAGTTSGVFRVIARHPASALADTAAVTIAAPNPSAVVLLDERFEDNAAGTRGWYDNLAWTTTTAEHLPNSLRSLEIRWTAGGVLPVFGGTARHLFTPTTSLYISYWVKYSTNWVGSGVAYHPHEFQILTDQSDNWVGPSFTNLTTYVEHRYYARGGMPLLGMTDGANIDVARVGQNLTNVTETRAVAGCNGNTDGKPTDCYSLGGGLYNNGKWLAPADSAAYFLPTAGTGYKNDWHHVEVFFQMNTIQNGKGQADGIAQYWFDGRLAIDERALLFRTAAFPTMKWKQFIIGPYIGPGSPVAQTMWVDDLLIATQRP
jgi:hypothetical protein